MSLNPIKDQVAFVGVGTTGFAHDAKGRSLNDLAFEASTQAILDAGLEAGDIDGVVGTSWPQSAIGKASARDMAEALGLEVTHHSNQPVPLGFAIVDAMNAVFSGSCNNVLVYHSVYRSPANSRSAANDPFRQGLGAGGSIAPAPTRIEPEQNGASGYALWASRYFYEYGAPPEVLGYIAINERSNAVKNPLAAMREPITMEDYFESRMVREPLHLLDMDLPVDGADAFVLTSTERARDLPRRPVLIHASSSGLTAHNREEGIDGLSHHGQHVAVKNLREKSDVWLPDVDLFYPYDGFTIITLFWIENVGWCKPGEGYDFIRSNWNDEEDRLMIDGRIPMNTHGGNLSEGGTQASGHIREAIVQLRGDGGERQVANAKTALLTPGGAFFNSQGLILHTES